MGFAGIGVAILIVSSLGGIFLSKRHTGYQQTAVKMILFGLYFWGLVFFQLLMVALVYALSKQGF